MKKIFLALAFIIILAGVVKAQSQQDSIAIKNTVLNYAEGFFTGDAERMEKALHWDLAKQTVFQDERGNYRTQSMTAMLLVQITKKQENRLEKDPNMKREVIILDIYDKMAVAQLKTDMFVDYLHLVRHSTEGWKIINVLWQNPVPEK